MTSPTHSPAKTIPITKTITNRINNDSDSDEEQDQQVSPAAIEGDGYRTEKEMEMVVLMNEVFETVSSMKKAYVSLQEAHCPWDPDKMRSSDTAVLAEIRKLAVLRERFRRNVVGGGGGAVVKRTTTVAGVTVREVVAPYEAAMEKLKAEVKSKEAEIENLREKVKTAAVLNGGGRFDSPAK